MDNHCFFSVRGHVAVVTGGGQGIGEGIARRLSAGGSHVAILDRDAANAKRVAASIDGLSCQCDVSLAPSVGKAFQFVREKLGSISILVNNAGITGRAAVLWDLDENDLVEVFNNNLKSTFLACKNAIPEMIERKYGRVLNVASIAGKEGNPTLVPYSSTKAAVIALTKALAKEVAGKGDITVNCISPGVISTKILDGLPQSTIDYMLSKIPIGRPGRVEEVAALVHYLVSPEASFTTGQCYDISGGRATY
jgi:NAD(P)-dependent dehydrogenase (short-subunit alcohol dehydrogenase family)